MRTLFSDLHFAARQLRSRPGFTLVAVLTLALGIGATTAIFSAVNPVLFKSLPYANAARIMAIWESRGGGSQLAVSYGTFHGIAERSHSFDALAVMKSWQPTFVGPDRPDRLEGQQVTPDYFRVLGITPRLGRDFDSSDDQFQGPQVVILSDALWRHRFNADPEIVGRQIKLDGNLYTVKGVMPASFENVLATAAELWSPLQYNPALPPDGREWGHHLQMIARLREGVTKQAANIELNAIIAELARLYPKGYESSGGAPQRMLLNPLQSDLTSGVRPVLLALLGAVIVVLLIACVNVTNLLLSRGAQRQGEFALRIALGAGRARLVRQLLTESLLLALIGGAVGLLVAQSSVRAIVALSPAELPRLNAIALDMPAFLFALAVTAVVGIITGLIPALQSSRNDPQKGLQRISRHATTGHQFARKTLVIAEVALALVLLVSAGLLLHSLSRIFAVDPGFETANAITMQVQESGPRYREAAARLRFFEQALQAVKQVPGVEAAAFTSQLPMSGDFETYGAEFEAYPGTNFEPAFRYAVTPDYFATMHIRLLSGRRLDDRDRAGAPTAILLSESLAKRKFPSGNAVGQRLRIGPDAGQSTRPWATIVGVVSDVRQVSLADTNTDAFYHTAAQWRWVDTAQTLVARTKRDPTALSAAIQKAIWLVDKDQPIVRVATMKKLVAESEAQRRFALILFSAFAVVALVLAAIGIYGVLSGTVTERIREIGVRVALGASRRDILELVLRQGVTLTVVGIVIGVVGAIAASAALVTLLFGISRMDPLTYAGVIGLLLGVSVVACAVPALRAANVDPSITLRAE